MTATAARRPVTALGPPSAGPEPGPAGRRPRATQVLVISDVTAPDGRYGGLQQQLARAVERTLVSAGGQGGRWDAVRVTVFDCDGRPLDALRSELAVQTRMARCLLVVTRVRHDSYSGVLKLALDSLDVADVAAKPVGLVSLGGSYNTHALDHLRVVMGALGATVVPQHLIAVDEDFEHGSATPQLTQRARQFVSTLSWFAARQGPAVARSHVVPHAVPGAAPAGRLVPPGPPDGDVAGHGHVRSSPAIGRAVCYLRENFTDPELTLDAVAGVAHLSRYHFSRTFKKETGQRFIDFLTALRMTEARSLLAATQLPVNEICRRVGYQEASHFQRTFRNSCGMSPTEFRHRSRAGDRAS